MRRGQADRPGAGASASVRERPVPRGSGSTGAARPAATDEARDPGAAPFDLLVVGLGPAGVACVLQGVREGLRVVAVGDQPPGGLLPAARRLDNLPGWPGGVGGAALARRMARQVSASGATRVRGTVVDLRAVPGGLRATLADGRALLGATLCLAPGTRPVPLPWPVAGGIDPARDARDLPRDLAGRRVLVIGGGDAAFDTALTARDRGAQVVVLVRGPALRAAAGLVREAAAAGIEVRTGTAVTGLAVRDGRWRVRVQDGPVLDADHVAACIGRAPRDELVRALAGASGPIPAAVFVAGDVHRGGERFAAAAMGDGQAAALAAAAWIRVRGPGGMR